MGCRQDNPAWVVLTSNDSSRFSTDGGQHPNHSVMFWVPRQFIFDTLVGSETQLYMVYSQMWRKKILENWGVGEEGISPFSRLGDWREKHQTPPGPWHFGDPLPRFLQIVSHNRLRRWKLCHLAISLEKLGSSSFFLRPQNSGTQWEQRRAGLAHVSHLTTSSRPRPLGKPIMDRVEFLHLEREVGLGKDLSPGGAASWAPCPQAGLGVQAWLLHSLLAGMGQPRRPSLPFSSFSSFWSQVVPGLH